MSKRRNFADVRRALIRRLDQQPDGVLFDLRNELWERLICRSFRRGNSIATVAQYQPDWRSTEKVENAIRSQVRKRGRI